MLWIVEKLSSGHIASTADSIDEVPSACLWRSKATQAGSFRFRLCSSCHCCVRHAAMCPRARQWGHVLLTFGNGVPLQHLKKSGCVWLQASLIGMQRQMAVSVRSCGICGEDLQDFGEVMSAREVAAGGATEGSGQGTVQLGCKHCFHPDCIRGWTIVGKKVCDAWIVSHKEFFLCCTQHMFVCHDHGWFFVCLHGGCIVAWQQEDVSDLLEQYQLVMQANSSFLRGGIKCRTPVPLAWRKWTCGRYLLAGHGRLAT